MSFRSESQLLYSLYRQYQISRKEKLPFPTPQGTPECIAKLAEQHAFDRRHENQKEVIETGEPTILLMIFYQLSHLLEVLYKMIIKC